MQVYNSKQRRGEESESESESVVRLEEYSNVFHDISLSAAKQYFTVADIGGIIKTAYINTVYKQLNIMNIHSTDTVSVGSNTDVELHPSEQHTPTPASVPTAVLFTPQELLYSYNHHSSASLSEKDIQFYNTIYNKFDPTLVDITTSSDTPDRTLQTTLA